MANTHVFEPKEELANAIIHGIGIVFGVVALTLLLVLAAMKGTPLHIVSFLVFGLTMIVLYVSSTLCHSFPEGKVKDIFETIDHAAIYVFIAGTYTPFLLLSVQGTLGWALFATVWSFAIFGIVFKWFFTKRFLYVSTILYLVMGWLIVIAWDQLVANLSATSLTFLIIGGILYSVGTVFYMFRLFKFHHAIWHTFVLGGSVVHFFAVLALLPH